jgi:hypothetical protein
MGKVKKKWIWESLEWVFKVQMWYPNHAWTCYIKKIGAMIKILPFNVQVKGSNPYFYNLSTLVNLGSLHG